MKLIISVRMINTRNKSRYMFYIQEFFVERIQELIYKPNDAEVNDTLIQDIRTSVENEDDFVKVYKDELQRCSPGISIEQIGEPSKQTTGLTLPDTANQKTLELRQQLVMTELSPDQLSTAIIAADYIPQENHQQVGL